MAGGGRGLMLMDLDSQGQPGRRRGLHAQREDRHRAFRTRSAKKRWKSAASTTPARRAGARARTAELHFKPVSIRRVE
jgi:hypothetical protein